MVSSRKINNNKNSSVQKKDTYNDLISKYLQKIDDQRNKLMVLRKYGIEKNIRHSNRSAIRKTIFIP